MEAVKMIQTNKAIGAIKEIKNLRTPLFYLLLACLVLSFPASGESYDISDLERSVDQGTEEGERPGNIGDPPETVEIEYGGRIISVDIRDVLLLADGKGGHTVDLNDPSKYESQLEKARLYGVARNTDEKDETDETDSYESAVPSAEGIGAARPNAGPNVQEITQREYEEEQRARRWANVFEDLTLREIDNKALELIKEFGEAKGAVPPITGAAGSVVITYSSYTPRIVCRPMYVTDIILQPGESVTGVHPGDPVRWALVPSVSGAGDNAQTHVLIKPLAADISTNVIINTDRRTYQLDLVSSARDFMPSISFAYPDDSLKAWNAFLDEQRQKRENTVTLASGYSVDPADLHLDYEVRGSDSLRWKPVRVWDDGVKTYIQFKKGSTKKSVEAPILVVYEHKKEVLVNYRASLDMFVVDRVFDKAALIVGTGSHQDRVVITRLKGR
jgi:type IV secretion system protein VirB9